MLRGLVQVILFVQDMQRQVEFYRDQLGLPVLQPDGLRDYRGEFWVTLDAGGCALALHGGGQQRQGEDAPKLVFGVRDMEAVREVLLARGVPLGDVRAVAPGIEICDGRDPEGNAFSLQARD
jgi:catechol 2,3-dioxygenase-like lactoylglutathione lyase family enzyme